jgi:DNA polymerase V
MIWGNAKHQIACTRSFGQPVLQLVDLQEAITEFACHAAEKLRRQDGHTAQVLVFIRTSPFRAKEPQYSKSAVFPLLSPTSDSREIAEAALAVLDAIYQPGFSYPKAGVMLLDLQPAERHQFTLDLAPTSVEQGGAGHNVSEAQPVDRTRLMAALDQVNGRYGRGTMLLASAGLRGADRAWTMKQEHMTQQYTTCWADLGLVLA